MEKSIISSYQELLRLKNQEPGSYSPLVLAYMGDAVYELFIRTKVVNRGNAPVNKLHKRTAGLVKAEAQAAMLKLLEEELTEEELAVYKRGRNAKSGTMAKNAAMKDYRMATGLEALLGWLYLSGREDRAAELISHGLKKMGELE